MFCRRSFILVWFCLSGALFAEDPYPVTVPGSKPLEFTGEIDRHLIAGVSRFLDGELAASRDRRGGLPEYTESGNWSAHRTRLRQRLSHILGMRDARPTSPKLEGVFDVTASQPVATTDTLEVLSVRWRAFGQVEGEGLLLQPKTAAIANVLAVPDADQTPEQLIGLTPGVPVECRYPLILACSGCRVLIPTIVSRQRDQFAWSGRRVDVTNREFLYRSAFELGRHIIGYEVQKLLAAVDWFDAQADQLPIGVMGWGEGGELALYAGALDDRIDVTGVSGYFAPRETVWQQPIDRNVFGLLQHFGDAELAVMLAPRGLLVEASQAPQVNLQGGSGGPGQLTTPRLNDVQREFARAQEIAKRLMLPTSTWTLLATEPDGRGDAWSSVAIRQYLKKLVPLANFAAPSNTTTPSLHDSRVAFDAKERLQRQMQQLDDHNQAVLRDSRFVRQQFMQQLEKPSVAEYEAAQESYRTHFAEQVIGRFEGELLPMNARTRKAYDEEKWVGYEVVLDVFPDVIAYGLLLMPKDLRPDEKRPVVVCQHGLEGRPQDVIGEASHHYYKAFAARLAERGFITFAPQNLYRHRDEFRVLQRKANPLGKTLFSIITPQHQQIIHWLRTLPQVDPDRIAFYGLSYGGKTAMRVPALLPDYCLSICSADFNEWVDKNASTHNPRSYVWTGEYEIFEFDLGSTFNYAEMAALIAPRPFMVERGHDDGVADDETVAYEFAKVRRRYVKLGIGDRCEIEWFDGPHSINGQGTYDFLHRHLDWPHQR